MDGLPDLLKPCRGGFETGQDRGEESLQFIQEILVSRSPDLYQRHEVLNYPQEVLYEGDQCLLAPSPPPLLIPASSVTPVTPPFSLDSLCPQVNHQNTGQPPKGKLSPAEVQQLLLHLPAPQPPAPPPPPSPTIQELTRCLMPLIEECVKRNLSTILSSFKDQSEDRRRESRNDDEVERQDRRLGDLRREEKREKKVRSLGVGRVRTQPATPSLAKQLNAALDDWEMGEEAEGGETSDLFKRIDDKMTTLNDYKRGASLRALCPPECRHCRGEEIQKSGHCGPFARRRDRLS